MKLQSWTKYFQQNREIQERKVQFKKNTGQEKFDVFWTAIAKVQFLEGRLANRHVSIQI